MSGYAIRLDEDRRAWLQTLIAACDRAAARLTDRQDPLVVDMLHALDDLRARLTDELGPSDPG